MFLLAHLLGYIKVFDVGQDLNDDMISDRHHVVWNYVTSAVQQGVTV